MTELLCTICHHTYTCEKFMFQLCGHGFCEVCTNTIREKARDKMPLKDRIKNIPKADCPACRAVWGTPDSFRIYIDFPGSDKSSRVIRHLESIDSESSAIFAKGAGDILKNLAEDTSVATDREKTAALLDAARRLEERVAPLMSNLEAMREEHGVLRRQLKTTQAQLKAKEALSTEIQRLHLTILEREAALSTTRGDLSHEKQKKQSENDNNRRLTRSLRKKQDELTTREKEIENLKTQIQERDKQLGLMKLKLRALGKLTKPSRSTARSPDDSLLVETPLSGIENAGSLRRSPRAGAGSSRRPISLTPSLSKRRKTDI